MNGGRYVHIIMPVGSDPGRFHLKRDAIDLGIKKVGFEARFPDYIPSQPNFILSKLIEEIRGAEAIIVDLSHQRPSCYYELGIAEGMGKKVFLIAERGTELHQSAARGFVRYYRDLFELTQIVEDLLKSSRDKPEEVARGRRIT
jgi:hypothetical protein